MGLAFLTESQEVERKGHLRSRKVMLRRPEFLLVRMFPPGLFNDFANRSFGFHPHPPTPSTSEPCLTLLLPLYPHFSRIIYSFFVEVDAEVLIISFSQSNQFSRIKFLDFRVPKVILIPLNSQKSFEY